MLTAFVLVSAQTTAAVSADRKVERPSKISVVTYNILADHIGNGWALRRDTLTQFIGGTRADIIALQEVTELQMADIAKTLPEYAYVFGERSDGHRGDQGWYEFNPILFKKARFDLIDSSSFWVSRTPGVAGSILPQTKAHARVVTWVKLYERSTGRNILVASAHIHGSLSSESREVEEVEIVLSELTSVRTNESVLLLGDFNFLDRSPGYKALVRAESGFIDMAPAKKRSFSTVIGPNGVTLDGGKSEPKPRMIGDSKRIDYIFACGAISGREYSVQPIRVPETDYYASDHHPVAVKVQFATTGCKM